MTSIQAALADAWSLFAADWRRYALRLTRDAADADDIVQDAIVRTLRAEPELPNERATRQYVMEAVKTSALKLYRGRENALRRPARKKELLPDSLPTALDVALAEESHQRRRVLIDHVRDELKRLPAEQRQAVELMVLREEPLKLREVSEIQDAPISTVHSRLQAAIEKLGQAMSEERPLHRPLSG